MIDPNQLDASPLQIVPERTRSSSTWLEAVSHLDAKYGGVSAVVPQLAARLSRSEGIACTIAAFCKDGEFNPNHQLPELSLTDWPISRAAWLKQTQLRKDFRKLAAETDGIHIHGLWTSTATIAAYTARSLRVPYIVSAHGMLEPWALKSGALKKKIYAALVERTNVHGAACLHALTHDEATDYRNFGCKQPIAVIPNGVTIPRSVSTECFLNAFPELRGKRIILFLGRLHQKKGLDILIKAWGLLSNEFPDARLVIAGPCHDSYMADLEALVAKCGVSTSTVFTGMVQNELKWSALANATGFVLPSYSEGFSVAALEAMGMGLPVIVSTNCHLPEVSSNNSGWEIAPDVPSLLVALSQLLSGSPANNAEIGSRGRHLVRERYSWQRVAHQMAELYRYVQGGPTPRTFLLQEASA